MTDILSAEQRSHNMAKISSKNTKPELVTRSLLFRMGYRFRLHRRDLPGTPDIVLPRYRTVIFVNGCYWHRHPCCSYAYNPKSRVDFWRRKFEQNVARDKHNYQELNTVSWRVIVIWECETRRPDELEQRLKDLLN